MGNDPKNLVDSFIERWQGREGGQERANYALFLSELCDVLDVDHPKPASAVTEHNDYVFERAVKFGNVDGSKSNGRIDLYKRGCFVLEAKQSRLKGGEKELSGQTTLFGEEEPAVRGRRDASRSWDVLMMNARQQAEGYARALPPSHGWPPFILICDVGHCIEIFADFSGQGKNYAQFPDRQGFRVYLEDLRDDAIRERLTKIWTDPHALDPARISAQATREIAERLAAVSKALEKSKQPPERVAMFLMRCLFTMFAEDVDLLPEHSFRDVLIKCEQDPAKFQPMVGQLWAAMDTGAFAFAIETQVKKFNGEFFKDQTVIPLDREEIGELRRAASANWRNVEPAIFGTLLEQALDPAERKRLGAHYTPRAYVERLVVATVIEPLRADWAQTLSTAERQKAENRNTDAVDTVRAFHDKLCATRVLDPACGTGNFLYVALELLKRLEGEVLEALAGLGGQEALSGLEGHSVDPHQFLGLELNPRAAAIAELVLWIGHLQWHYRTNKTAPSEPILKAFRNILVKDAVLLAEVSLARGEDGKPLSRIGADGNRFEIWEYRNPRRPEWPAAEFIVGNPPFIGGKDLRDRLGNERTEALWRAHPKMNDSADFVMYWWDHAAELLTRKGTVLRRFGFVTTNSISQVFQRKVLERHLNAKKPVSIVMAIPDHPWTKATRDSAAVRIAMTVVEAGSQQGVLLEVVREADLDTDQPTVVLSEKTGAINSDLTTGVDITKTIDLQSNRGLCCNGMKPLGAGFLVSEEVASKLGLGRNVALTNHIRPYRNGRDLTSRSRNVFALDFFGLTANQLRIQFPESYQHLLQNVKPERDAAAEKSQTRDAQEYAEKWWLFCKPRQEMRDFLQGIPRYIVTVQTAKHRVFQFLDIELMPDQKLMVFGFENGYPLGILSSRVHCSWAIRTGSWLGVGNDSVYVKSRSFDHFPFPSAIEAQQKEICELAEELDAHRKRQQEAHPTLTLTGMYNVLERLRAGATPETLNADERVIFDDGLVLILKELHDQLDVAVAAAYGWPADLTDEEILARLVALNKERAAEEARGIVRWLRPDYQIERFGTPTQKAQQLEADLVGMAEDKQKPLFPRDDMGQTAVVMAALAAASAPLGSGTIAAGFRQGRRIEPKVTAVLVALTRMGLLSSPDGGKHFLLPRAA